MNTHRSIGLRTRTTPRIRLNRNESCNLNKEEFMTISSDESYVESLIKQIVEKVKEESEKEYEFNKIKLEESFNSQFELHTVIQLADEKPVLLNPKIFQDDLLGFEELGILAYLEYHHQRGEHVQVADIYAFCGSWDKAKLDFILFSLAERNYIM